MATLINVPRVTTQYSFGVRINKWYVNVGEKVYKGDYLAILDYETAFSSPVKASVNGTVLFILEIEDSQIISEDELLVIIGEEGEDISQLLYQIKPSKAVFDKYIIDVSKPLWNVDWDIIPASVHVVTFELQTPGVSRGEKYGTVTKWHKKIGDLVKKGDKLVDFKSKNHTESIWSSYNGSLLYKGTKEGEKAGTKNQDILGLIGPERMDVSEIIKQRNLGLPSTENLEFFKIPKLHYAPDETIVKVTHKNIGEHVEVRDIVLEIETQRKILWFYSFYDGEVLYTNIKEGAIPNSNELIAVIGPPDTDVLKAIELHKSQEI